MATIELHSHSCYSDGLLSPAELVQYAATQGIETLALVDHDTLCGIREATSSGEKVDIKIIPGIEISAGNNLGEYHILGYFVDWEDKSFQELVEQIWSLRENRNKEILKNLSMAGYPIEISDVETTVGFKWIDRKDIALTLERFGYVKSFQEAFTDKLLGTNSPLFIPSPHISPKEAIETILHGNGIPVLAHPGICPGGRKDAYPIPHDVIVEFKNWGLKGIETFYIRHSPEMVKTYREFAEELGLIETGGSDFHRKDTNQPSIGRVAISPNTIQKLLAARQ